MSKSYKDIFEAREFRPEDAGELAGWMSPGPFELFNLSSTLQHPLKPSGFMDFYEKNRSETHKFYSAFLKDSGEYVGHFEIKNIRPEFRIGTGAHIVLAPGQRGRGMGRYFADLISSVGFDELGLYRMSVSVIVTNTPAVAAYVRAGYRFEGLIRDVLEFQGQRHSLYQMALLRPQWEEAGS